MVLISYSMARSLPSRALREFGHAGVAELEDAPGLGPGPLHANLSHRVPARQTPYDKSSVSEFSRTPQCQLVATIRVAVGLHFSGLAGIRPR